MQLEDGGGWQYKLLCMHADATPFCFGIGDCRAKSPEHKIVLDRNGSDLLLPETTFILDTSWR